MATTRVFLKKGGTKLVSSRQEIQDLYASGQISSKEKLAAAQAISIAERAEKAPKPAETKPPVVEQKKDIRKINPTVQEDNNQTKSTAKPNGSARPADVGIDENPLNQLEGGYTYYSRLTLMHPKDINSLDPSKGRVLCETATTGKFIIDSIVWDGTVSPNSTTSIAYNTTGEFKVYEPLGVRFLDYIRFAALELGLMNHFDARYLLEIEILSAELDDSNKQFRWAWPIMILATEVKGGVSEKGTEYNIKFAHTGQHAQTDMVQPLKETVTIDGVSQIKEYFKNFGKELEKQEFIYAKAGQKAGSGATSTGGDHPAASDPYHDEYHFILDPRIEEYTLTSSKGSGKDVQGSYLGIGSLWGSYNVSAKGGSTIIAQIQRVLSSTEQAANLYLENYGDRASVSGSQSSKANEDSLKSALGKIYNFFRIDTHAVYKSFDYIRNRYAVKHVFIVYLAMEPTLYQYPDELSELNKPENKNKVITKLKAYVQEGLLRKAYYYQYTGLNSEILKFNIQLNQMYYLPSFPVVWADRGQTGPGPIKPQNFSKQLSPFGRYNSDNNESARLAKEQTEARNLSQLIANEKNATEKKKLQTQLAQKKASIESREKALSASGNANTSSQQEIRNRGDMLATLKNSYIEDVDYLSSVTTASTLTAAHQPRSEPDKPSSIIDDPKQENQHLMDKIFAVQLAARDLVEIDLDIKGDPFWLGTPSIALAGKQSVAKLGLPPAVEDKVNEVMPSIDSEYNTDKKMNWSTYDGAKYYKGANLFYLNSQLPVNDFGDDDLMKFSEIDQVIGIYKVVKIKNEFKNGQWLQSIHAVRDLTIPSQFLPRASVGQGFENWVKAVGNETTRASDTMRSTVEKENIKKSQDWHVKYGGEDEASRRATSVDGGTGMLNE